MAKKKKYGSGTGTPAMNITNNPNATQMPKPKGYGKGKGTGTPAKNITNNPNATKMPKKKHVGKKAKNIPKGTYSTVGALVKKLGGGKKKAAKKKSAAASGDTGRAPATKKKSASGKRNVPRLKGRAYKKGTREAAARSH